MKNIPCCDAHPHFSTVNIELEASHYLVTILTLPYKSAMPQTNPNFPNKKRSSIAISHYVCKTYKTPISLRNSQQFSSFFIDFNIQSNFS